MDDDDRPRKLAKISHDSDLTAIGTPSQDVVGDTNTAPTSGDSPSTGQLSHTPADNDTNLQNSPDADDDLLAPEDVAPLVHTAAAEAASQPLSKNAQKKLRRKQEWESKRAERKIIRKEKLVAKRERKKAEKRQAAALRDPNDPVDTPPARHARPQSTRAPVTIMIDCEFDDLMRDNERVSLAGQIVRSYSSVRTSTARPDLAICAFTGHLKDRFENVLIHHKQWRGVHWYTDEFVTATDMARKTMIDNAAAYNFTGPLAKYTDADDETMERLKNEAEIVYLSSDSSETLTELKPFSTYIVGGLVDKNREKGLCHRRAVERGVKTARLPIGEFLEMQSRKILATNHVCEIMVAWLECGDWGEAFMKIIPKRKGGRLKEAANEDEDEGDDENDDTEQVAAV